MERLQKVIANNGYCSRRKAEELITKGKVFVNGNLIMELGVKVNAKDTIEVEGNVLGKDDKEYILLYKPRGVVTTTSDDKHRKTVVDLISTDKRLYPVGRLDYDTTGVLILTNDGEFANMLMHPKSNIDKVYIAKVKGFVDGKIIKQLSDGVYIDNIKTARAKVKLRKLDKKNQLSIIELTIHEGKNHQIKRMFETVGCEVVKLKRESVSFLNLKGLNAGDYRYLSPKEVKKLYGATAANEKE